MTDIPKMKVDSPEGIETLMRWAVAHQAILDPAHEAIAQKHGVPIPDGLLVSRPIPRQSINKDRSNDAEHAQPIERGSCASPQFEKSS